MTVNDLYDKFVYHLEEMYYVENQLLDVLDDLRIEVTNDKLQNALEEHRGETRDHVDNLEGIFAAIDEPTRERTSPVFDALLKERSEFFDQAGPDEDMRDVHDLGAAAKTEHVEVAGYENLIMLAKKLDLPPDIRDALEENMEDEKEAKKKLNALAEDSTVKEAFGRLTA